MATIEQAIATKPERCCVCRSSSLVMTRVPRPEAKATKAYAPEELARLRAWLEKTPTSVVVCARCLPAVLPSDVVARVDRRVMRLGVAYFFYALFGLPTTAPGKAGWRPAVRRPIEA